MRIIVDTSVIIAVLMNEKHAAELKEITRKAELIAPPSLHWEIGNAFSAMLRRGRINLNQAKQALNLYSKIPIKLHPVQLERVLDLANKYNLYAYDVYFIVCAQNLRVPIISLDKKLIEIGKKLDLNIIEVLK